MTTNTPAAQGGDALIQLVALIVRDCCEAEAADPDEISTICIDVENLNCIVREHLTAAALSAPAPAEPIAVGDPRNPFRHPLIHDGYVAGFNARPQPTTQGAAIDAEQLGKQVAEWAGGTYIKTRGDTGKPEQWIDTSVPRLGHMIKRAITTQAAPTEPAALTQADLSVEMYPPRPTGGMVVGMSKGVRVTHIPTGVSVAVDSERSQHRNRDIALERLAIAVGAVLAAARTPTGE